MKKPADESILIVDDDFTALALYETLLKSSGYQHIIVSGDGREVADLLRDNRVALVLLDINMPGMNGIEVLESVVAEHPGLPVIMITGDEDLQTVVRCMKIGAYDYIAKPPELTRLTTAVRHAVEWRELNRELSALGSRVLHRESLEHPDAFRDIITVSSSMLDVFQYVEAVAPSARPILITGESGTGKELLARAIHEVSGRKGPLVTVNAAGLDDTLFSDTLFGHRKGAFSDAVSDRAGLVEKAAGGTLFLDEIGDLAPVSQVKLLRLLQEKEYLPLGSDEQRTTDARVIAATCADLPAGMEKGSFRRDLYFRLKAHQVHLPPLRERREDLMPLVRKFLRDAADELSRPAPKVPPELEVMLNLHEFPGNVRELHSLVFDALSRSSGNTLNLAPFRALVGRDFLTPAESSEAESAPDYDGLAELFGHFPTIKEVTDILFDAALEKAAGNQTLAARLLGVNQSTLSRRIARDSE